MNDTTAFLDDIKPHTEPFDPTWSAETLTAIMAKPLDAPARGRRRLALVGAVTAGVVGLGGVAYAAGVVPTLWWSSHSAVTGVHEVASFDLSDDGTGHTFQIWRGTDADGDSCISVVELAAKGGPDFSGNCGDYPTDAWFNSVGVSYNGTIDDVPPAPTHYVYGEPAVRGVTSVRVTGEGFEHRVDIDQRTGGYAVAIPELPHGLFGHFATVEFLDAAGTVVGTRELTGK